MLYPKAQPRAAATFQTTVSEMNPGRLPDMKLRVIADKIDPKSGRIIHTEQFEVDGAECNLGQGSRSGSVILSGPMSKLPVSDQFEDYQCVRVTGTDGTVREMLSCRGGIVVHLVGMTG